MIEPLDFTKYEVPEFPQFPHSLHYHKENYEEAVAEWHQINDFVTEEFRADLEDYLINYLAIELGEQSIYIHKIRKLVDIAMEDGIEFDEVVNLSVRMLPLLQADKPF
jgi:hypothetical protein